MIDPRKMATHAVQVREEMMKMVTGNEVSMATEGPIRAMKETNLDMEIDHMMIEEAEMITTNCRAMITMTMILVAMVTENMITDRRRDMPINHDQAKVITKTPTDNSILPLATALPLRLIKILDLALMPPRILIIKGLQGLFPPT